MIELLIGRIDSDHIVVHILGRSSFNRGYFGGVFLSAEIEISAGGFRGQIGANLSADELSVMGADLARLYSFDSRGCDFRACDGSLRIKIDGDGLGNFGADCEAADRGGNALSFHLTFDQTQIPEMIRKLSEVHRKYCVI